MGNEILKICMEKGFLLDKEMLEIFSELEAGEAKKVIDGIEGLGIVERVITKNVFSKNIEKIKNVLVDGKSKMVMEKFFINMGYARHEVEVVDCQEVDKKETGKVKVISSSVVSPKKISVKDFVNHFKARYEQMRHFLMVRDLENLTSIRKIGDDRDSYTIIASVVSKRITKNKNLMLDVEDLTGSARVLVNQNKGEVYDKAKDLLLDDVVAFSVSGNSEWLYANDVIFPDCMLHEKRKYEEDVWVAFTSDLHAGSTMFLEKNFLRFIDWLNGKSELHKDIAEKVRYLFFLGDNVDGVGVYPGQDSFLELKDIKDQYSKVANLLKMIPKDLNIVLCPGQHDAVRVAEPQPIIGEYYAPGLYEIDNLTLVSNPCTVEIDGGFKILMYHGAGMHGFVDAIDDIRLNYGHEHPVRVVKEILKRRHLCPTHGDVTYLPGEKEDPLIVKEVPDIIVTGDWHRCEVGNYNNILIISGSCWQSKTPFEEKVGHDPDPCKVALFNLKTREIKILDFSDDKNDGGEDGS